MVAFYMAHIHTRAFRIIVIRVKGPKKTKYKRRTKKYFIMIIF